MVDRRIGQTAAQAMSRTSLTDPMPRTAMKSGTSAITGVARNMSMTGPQMPAVIRDRPQAYPTTRPTTRARAMPSTRARRLGSMVSVTRDERKSETRASRLSVSGG
ncbi:hypothetical protein LUX39_18110 [Actinomadura madurae]|nr:hypothetical protein [Actinomadura madurae]MCP9949982.1 hypothetical protein [Actinomadura madurae]MCQ0015417.1 hypothetical protein [Actinomadura madurae]